MIATVSCQCGSVDSLIRNFLNRAGYQDWAAIPINRGKERSLSVCNQLPPCPEKDELKNFLKNASKWAIIIGYDQNMVRWADLAHDGAKSRIEAEFIVKNFQFA